MKLVDAMAALREADLNFRNADFLYAQGSAGRTEGQIWEIKGTREQAVEQLDRAAREVLAAFDRDAATVDAMAGVVAALNEALKAMPDTTSRACPCVLFAAHGSCWHVEGKRAMEQLASGEVKLDA